MYTLAITIKCQYSNLLWRKKMARPTDDAKDFFLAAESNANSAIIRLGAFPATTEQLIQKELLQAIWSLAVGSEHLSVGLRATYILLEEVKGGVKR
jgi:hypothetical protein